MNSSGALPPLRRFEPKKFCHWLWKYSTVKRYVLQHRQHIERNDKKEKRKRKTQTYLEQEQWIGRQQFEINDIQIRGKRAGFSLV